MDVHDFRAHVLPAELDEIRNRRVLDDGVRGENFPEIATPDARNLEHSAVLEAVLEELTSPDNDESWKNDDEALHKGLVGLAFSGGGIRSATYNLGVLQALDKLGLLKHVDYLSTVSGGGYLGSCVSSLLASIKDEPREGMPAEHKFPFRHERGKREPNVFRYLRNHANYLAPAGFIDMLRIPALLLRGIVVNMLVLLPYVLVAAMVTIVIKPTPEALVTNALQQVSFFNTVGTFVGPSFMGTKLLSMLMLAMFAVYPFAHMYLHRLRGDSSWTLRNAFEGLLGRWVFVIGVAFLLELQPLAIRELYAFKAGGWTATELSLFGSTATALSANKLLPYVARRAGRFTVYLLGLLGVAAIWVLYLNLCIFGIYGGIYGFEGSTVALDHREALQLYGIIALAVGAYTMLTVDLNVTGIHKFYRDRLSKAYIVGFEEVASSEARHTHDYQLDHTDSVKLSELDTKHAPYHLINTVINLEHPKKSYQKGRGGDFFLFSKRYIGGEVTGYCPTERMEQTSRAVDLGTAMAISGAAAAPNMGKKTVKPLVFVLAMLNVRLNYWLPNPNRVKDPLHLRLKGAAKEMASKMPRAPWSRVGPLYLLWEMFGKLSASSRHVNLSDGGHIENLGVYELLRRECRLIIAGDGEADAGLEFEGLADAIRMALIDFGISIEVDGLDEIRRGEQHHAIGTIRYRNGRIGKLIYLKSSLLGDNNLKSTLAPENYTSSPYRDDNQLFDDNPYIGHYKSLHPEFPHESTGDQFFDEAQFECYRALGYQVAMNSLGRRA